MAGRSSLLKQEVVRARSGGSCAEKYVPTVVHYWRVSALVRDVYWTGSIVSESYRLVENRSRRLWPCVQQRAAARICEYQLTAHLHASSQA
jgi:hypothetical protein